MYCKYNLYPYITFVGVVHRKMSIHVYKKFVKTSRDNRKFVPGLGHRGNVKGKESTLCNKIFEETSFKVLSTSR